MGHEERLSGGMTSVTRIGDEVRRATGPWTSTIHDLLNHVDRAGFDHAPKVLGLDEQGRERLTYIPGAAANYPLSEAARSENVLIQVGTLLRRYHDITSSFTDSVMRIWRDRRLVREPFDVICHNDIAPFNTVLEGEHVEGFIDFDYAAPGTRLWDFVHAAYRWIPLCANEQAAAFGWNELPDRVQRLKCLLSAYGLTPAVDALVAETIARVTLLRDGHLGPDGIPSHLAAYESDLAWISDCFPGIAERATT